MRRLWSLSRGGLLAMLLGAVTVWSHSQDSELAARLAPRLAELGAISGEFSQQRFISVLSLPLNSRGEFSYERDTGVIWRTLSPVESTVMVTPDQGVLAGDSDGNLQALSSSQLLADIFLAVFSGDLQPLTALFAVAEQEADSGWALLLTPRDKALGDYLASVKISGDAHVEEITLSEGNGDRTVITLRVTAEK